MKIYTSLPTDLPPTGLSIGTFDGVHLGHRALFKRLLAIAPVATVLTFSNHPLEILKPNEAPPLLTPLPQKLRLLEACGLDAVIAIPFTAEFAFLTYADLLARFPLTHLILGEGDAFGKNREGDQAHLLRLALERKFCVEYLPKITIDGDVVSSRRIRALLASGDPEAASRLLGYSATDLLRLGSYV